MVVNCLYFQTSRVTIITMLHFLVLLAVSEAFVVEPWVGSSKRCNNPKFWCQSMDNAKECGVVEYCNIEWGKAQRTEYIKVGNVPAKAKVQEPKKDNQRPDVAPVKVTLYYESLCPDCRQFMQNQFYPAYEKLISTGILDVELVPYGNAQEYQYGNTWVFTCQHGASECTGNLIETCALHYAPNATLYMPFIYCLEYFGPSPTNAQYCASQHGLNYNQIYYCVYGTEGNGLEHEMGLKTEALNPRHQYVPWITVNGVHTDAIQTAVQSNMLQYVCSVYQGTKPAVCNQVKDKRLNVCHKN